ncbi:MAG: CRISPR-associated helicase Cas3' [Candidatus Altiarchaeia archaeon]
MEPERISSLLNEPKSHPDKLLRVHLGNVGSLAQAIFSSKKLNLDKYVPHKTLSDVLYLIGITHDFGKGTVFFQEYINEKDDVRRNKLKNKPTTHHGFISSIFTYYSVKRYLEANNLLDKDYCKYLPIISFLAVKRHHGNLHNANDETYDFDEKNKEILRKQIIAINADYLNGIYLNLFPIDHLDIKKFQENFESILKELNNKQKSLVRNIDEDSSLFYYFLTIFFYSILLDADKTDAANLNLIQRVNISNDVVDEYRKSKFKEIKNKIDVIRNQIYEEVIQNIEKEEINFKRDKILSLNVPTGTGKTLTSLSFALKIREKIKESEGYTPRIIYALPFLTVIDQNYDVFKSVLNNPTTDILLKHHHLSDIFYKTKEDEFENQEGDIQKDLLLIEGWNSEIIVTTFVQFFHSLISNKNKAIRKVHNIANSIVILDEVQAVPHEYWLLLNKMMKFFSDCFNTHFLLLTATQPLIFDESKGEIKSLVGNKQKYFESLNRVTLKINLKSLLIDDFIKILDKEIIKHKNEDFLIVLNTIDSSIKVYEGLKNLDSKNSECYYLSTNIVPKERMRKIGEIKERNGKRKIIISTQLIEAGVDIDTDIVYRDLAPLDSINQVAGRCNRNFREINGVVNVVSLIQNNNGHSYKPSSIYGKFLISKTEKVLRKEEILESEFFALNQEYFQEVKELSSDCESKTILKHVEAMDFDELLKFKLIDDDYPELDVFIELDKEAEQIWKKFIEIKNIKNHIERKKAFLVIKKDFYDHVISVPEAYANKVGYNEDIGIGRIAIEDIGHDRLYDPKTGFNKDAEPRDKFC